MGNLIKHRSIGKIRMEFADYVLNCTGDELYELCSTVSELQGVTSWSCDECKKRFNPDCSFDSDEARCKKHFFEMNKPE